MNALTPNTRRARRTLEEEIAPPNNKMKMKPETLFLIIAVFFGFIFAAFQPLFIEPDSAYHFEASTYIANDVVDRAKLGFIGEDYSNVTAPFGDWGLKANNPYVSNWQKGVSWISSTVKNGTYYKIFFEDKLPVVNKDMVQDKRVLGSTWSNDIAHAVPALGTLVGRLFSPTVGAMVLGGRFLNLIFFILSLFFIIKYLKTYKYLFVFVSLTPTVIQIATSLSYDCFAYVTVAFATATCLNVTYMIKKRQHFNIPLTFLALAVSALVLINSKENFKLVLALVALVFIAAIGSILRLHFSRLIVGVIGVACLIGLVVTALVIYLPHYPLLSSKIYYTLLEPYYTVLSTQIISGTAVGGIPAWFYGVQFATLMIVFLSERAEQIPKWFAYSAFTIFVVNLVGVIFTYALNKSFPDLVATGVQGRYFTPTLLLLGPVMTIFAKKIGFFKGSFFTKLVVIVTLLALTLNFGVSATRFYVLHHPLDEFRSGEQHYIMKK